jgi:hypothetical protein
MVIGPLSNPDKRGKKKGRRCTTLLGWRQIIVGVVPSVVRKTEAWLVVAKARRRKWPKWWRRVGKEKLGRKMVFSQFWLLISPLDN